ncbi:hypothetical protein BSF_09700 [Bacillus subtilis]|nr:hypothetical protein BSF_09700 [Bacillus subtilis]
MGDNCPLPCMAVNWHGDLFLIFKKAFKIKSITLKEESGLHWPLSFLFSSNEYIEISMKIRDNIGWKGSDIIV